MHGFYRLRWKLNSKRGLHNKVSVLADESKRSCKGSIGLGNKSENKYPYEGLILCLVGD